MRFTLFVFLCAPLLGQIGPLTAYSHSVTGAQSVTIPVTAAAGDTVWCVAGFNANGSGCGAHVNTLSDGVNTYVQIGLQQDHPYNCAIQGYAKNVIGGILAVKDTYFASGGAAASISCFDIPGASPTPLIAGGNGNTSACPSGCAQGATSPITVSGLSGTSAGNVMVAGATNYYAATWTADTPSGIAIPPGATASGGNGNGNSTAEYLILGSAAASASIKLTGTVYADFFVATFASGAVAGPTCVASITIPGDCE